MKLQFCLLDADYIREGERTIIRLWGKTSEGKKVAILDHNFYPYFYVLPLKNKIKDAMEKIKSEVEKSKEKILKIEIMKRKLGLEEREFLKIYCYNPQDTQHIRELIKKFEKKRGGNLLEEEYEYGFNFYKRYLIDNSFSGFCWLEVEGEKIEKPWNVDIVLKATRIEKIKKNELPKLKILAFDLETIEEKGEHRIVMISIYGKNYRKVLTIREVESEEVEVFKSEKGILEKFVEIVKKENPDIILTYNGDSFDFPVLERRAKELKVKLDFSRDNSEVKFERRARISSARIYGIVHLDLFDFVNNILSPQLQTEVLTLDAVASELLGDKKIEMEYEEIIETWRKRKDLKKLVEYCLKDAELTFRLGEYLLPQIVELSKLVAQLPFDVSRMTYSQLVEWFLSKKAFLLGYIIPNQPKWEEIQRRRARPSYIGGFVKEPIAGIHENIAVMDFRSLYPSIMATFNVSPETLNCECCKNNGYKVPGLPYWFCKREKGFVSSVIRELIEKRAAIKKEMRRLRKSSKEWERLNNEQFAIKTISNAMYGSFAFAGAKWYCYECAESLAAFGRKFIGMIIEEAEMEGFDVIYCDTDSIFIKVKEGDLKKRTFEFLEKINEKLPGMIELDLQGFYKRGIFIPRGIAPGTAKKRYALIDERGNLTIRGLETVRRDWCLLAKEVQRKVLEFVLRDNDIDKAVEYVRSVVKKLRERKIPLRELIIYEQLTKPLSEYKQISPHVAAARKIKERGRPIGIGMIVMFVITRGKGSISERAEPIEDVNLEQVDVDYYINNQIVPAALRVLQVLGVNEEKLLGKVSGLERFF
jgi:DNA polymerase I/DNA polymerase-2